MSNGARVIKHNGNAREGGTGGGVRDSGRDREPKTRTLDQRLETLYRDAQRMTNRIKNELEEVRRNGIR